MCLDLVGLVGLVDLKYIAYNTDQICLMGRGILKNQERVPQRLSWTYAILHPKYK